MDGNLPFVFQLSLSLMLFFESAIHLKKPTLLPIGEIKSINNKRREMKEMY